MSKLFRLVFAMLFLISTSFTVTSINENFVGHYGMCAERFNGFEIKINKDQTFYYRDFSDQNNKVEIVGTWKQKGNKFVLISSLQDNIKFFNTWKISNNRQVIMGRKKMCWLQLSRL